MPPLLRLPHHAAERGLGLHGPAPAGAGRSVPAGGKRGSLDQHGDGRCGRGGPDHDLLLLGGPGLGNIAGAQGDYFQAVKGGGHGDYRNIVLAPASVQELADLTVLAFDLADKYRMVAMVLGDGHLGQMSEPLRLPSPSGLVFDKTGWALTGARDREHRILYSLRLSPEDAVEKINLRLQAKYREAEAAEVRFEAYQAQDAEVLLVSFGLASRVCRAAIQSLRAGGQRVGLFRPITLWPFPFRELADAAAGARRVLVVEMNAGQMLEDVRLALGERSTIEFYGRMGAMIVEEEEIVRRCRQQ